MPTCWRAAGQRPVLENVTVTGVAPWALLTVVTIGACVKIYAVRLRHTEAMANLSNERDRHKNELATAKEAARLEERKHYDERFTGHLDRVTKELQECREECKECHKAREADNKRAVAQQLEFERRVIDILALTGGATPGQPLSGTENSDG